MFGGRSRLQHAVTESCFHRWRAEDWTQVTLRIVNRQKENKGPAAVSIIQRPLVLTYSTRRSISHEPLPHSSGWRRRRCTPGARKICGVLNASSEVEEREKKQVAARWRYVYNPSTMRFLRKKKCDSRKTQNHRSLQLSCTDV